MTVDTRATALEYASKVQSTSNPESLLEAAAKIEAYLNGPAADDLTGEDIQLIVKNELATHENDRQWREYNRRADRSTGWFVGIIVALALLAIGYLVWSANKTEAPASVPTEQVQR